MSDNLLKTRTWKTELIALAVLIVLLAFCFQGTRAIWQPDEGYYVGTAVTMLEKNSLLTPFLGEDEIFLDKPPMIYWQIITGLKIFGHNEFAVRFFHGLSFALTSIVVGLLTFSMFNKKYLAYMASLIYATMVVPFIAANFITPDTLLTLWSALTMLFFWQTVKPNAQNVTLYKMLLCLAAGLGFLAKGPAILIPCGGMFIFLLLTRQTFRYFINTWSIAGLAIFCFVGLGWYFWISLKIPGALDYLIDSQIWGRLISQKFRRNPGLTGALIYLPVILCGSLPWSVIWIEKINTFRADLFKSSSWKNLHNNPQKLFLVTVFFLPLTVLCLASSKLGLYALPLFIPLAIATAKLWHDKIGEAQLSNIKICTRPAAKLILWTCMLILAKLALAFYPTENNMQKLSEEIAKVTGKQDYELGTVDKRADGLLFYGVKKVEHLTAANDAYPTFSETEQVLTEISEMLMEKEQGFLLVHGQNRTQKTCLLLKNANINFQMINLPYDRVLLKLHLPDNSDLEAIADHKAEIP